MKISKKILLILFILLISMFIIKIPTITNISYATTIAYKHIGSKTLNRIVVNTSTKTYTGKKIEPEVTIYRNDNKLTKGKDYTVKYKNNKNTGKATIEIKGIGEYYGIVKKSFYIVPKKPTLYSVKIQDFNKAKIHWKKDSQADGYRIYMSTSKNGEYEKIKTISDKNVSRYIKSGLDPDTKYYFKIESYKIVDGKKKYSKFSNIIKKDTPKKLAEVTLTASSSTTNRNKNIELASKACNNIILKPGESFVWSKVVGEATAQKGYKKAIIFINKKPKIDYGGGICQVSSTVYQTAKKCKLKIIERHTHSLPVTYTTTGNDATVAHGSKNLIFKNNKSYSIKIVMTSDGKSCTCKIYKV